MSVSSTSAGSRVTPRPPRGRVSPRPLIAVIACAVVALGCGGADGVDDLPAVTAPPPVTLAPVAGPDPDEVPDVEPVPFGLPEAVEVAVRVSPARVATLVSFSPRSAESSTLDPFDAVASCSVIEAAPGRPFEVVVADPDEESSVRLVADGSEPLPPGAPSVEVGVEVRLLGGPVRFGSARVTFARAGGAVDQRSGTVVGATASGQSISAAFTCSGSRPEVTMGEEAGYSIRMRDGTRVRTAAVVVSEAEGLGCADPVDADRSVVAVSPEGAATGGGGGVLTVTSRPGLATGASAPGDVVVTVLGRTVVLGDAVVTLTGPGTGIFGGVSADGVVVDGAWRCPSA
jgi:hypothetical protein